MNNNEYALIVAGGRGTRMGKTSPKQYMLLKGKPILFYTLDAFYRYSSKIKVILVLHEDDMGRWADLCTQYNFDKPITIQKGGITRFQSVKNGLKAIKEEGLVAIHDGVRPLVSPDIIEASFRLAATNHSAVAAVSLKDSLCIIDHGRTKSVARSQYKLVQTPQTFKISLIKSAYEREEENDMSDDASVAERAGYAIHLFEGSDRNIKITTINDLAIAETWLKADHQE